MKSHDLFSPLPGWFRRERGATYTMVFAVALPAIMLLTTGVVDVTRFQVAKDDLASALEQGILGVESDPKVASLLAEGVFPPTMSECTVRASVSSPCLCSNQNGTACVLNGTVARAIAITACERTATILAGGAQMFNYQYTFRNIGTAFAAEDPNPEATVAPAIWNKVEFKFGVFVSDGSGTMKQLMSNTPAVGELPYCAISVIPRAMNDLMTEISSKITASLWGTLGYTGGKARPTYWLAGMATSEVNGFFSKYLTDSDTRTVSVNFIRALPWPYTLENKN